MGKKQSGVHTISNMRVESACNEVRQDRSMHRRLKKIPSENYNSDEVRTGTMKVVHQYACQVHFIAFSLEYLNNIFS